MGINDIKTIVGKDGTVYRCFDDSSECLLPCLAAKEKLLVGTFDVNSGLLKESDVAFFITGINHSYDDWVGSLFEDYNIDIIQGTKEDVENCFDEYYVLGCENCCGCGDW